MGPATVDETRLRTAERLLRTGCTDESVERRAGVSLVEIIRLRAEFAARPAREARATMGRS